MRIPSVYDNGGPAFPISIPGCGDNGAEGMSLRDYFAAQVLFQVYATASAQSNKVLDELFGKSKTNISTQEIAAALAYKMADEMLKRRSQ